MADTSQCGTASNSGSVQTVVTSFVYNGVIAIVFLILLVILRPRNKNVYEKRMVSNTIADEDRPRALKSGPIAWIPDLLTRPDNELVRDVGIDGYFFLRYLRFMLIICVFGTVFLCALLLPLNATGGCGAQGFDMLAFGNVGDSKRYYAHSLGLWVFYLVVLYLIYRELLFYTGSRHALLTSESYRTRLSSRTILVNGVSRNLMTEEYFRSIYSGVKYVFLARNSAELDKLIKERDGLASKVEATENKQLTKGLKAQAKLQKKGNDEKGALSSYLKKPATFRLKKYGLPIGEKVETLEYCKTKIPELNQQITKLQTSRESHDPLLACFVTFYTQRDAEMACQTLGSNQPYHLTPRFIGITPDEVIWKNLNMPWYQRIVRSFGASTLAFLVCIFWCIPTAFVGFISQISTIESILHFYWLNNLPSVLFGLISSMLPTILLAVLMMLLPPFIRWMARVSGAPSTIHVEYFTQQVFFVFQIVQVFIVTTLASSILSTLEELLDSTDPGSIILSVLSTKLPQASNFFLSYIILQALTVPFGALLQIVALLLFHALGRLLDNTPRKRWTRRNVIGGVGWGTVFPVYTCLACITFSYAAIAPLIFPFSILLFGFTYFAFANNLLMVNGPTNGRGIYYSRALYQTFVGIYLSQVVMIILFVFAKAWGPVAITAVNIFFTIWCQTHFQRAFQPLLFALPENLLVKQKVQANDGAGAGAAVGTSVYNPKQSFEGSEHAPTLSGAGRLGEKESADSAGLIERQEQQFTPSNIPSERGTLMQRFLKPHLYYQADVLRKHLFDHPSFNNAPAAPSADVESTAYFNPAFKADNPVVWFPADPNGWADEQMDELRRSDINAYTTGARYVVNEKFKTNFETSRNIVDIPVYAADAGF